MHRVLKALLLCSLGLLSLQVVAREIQGVKYEESIDLAGTRLQLNGAGTRYKADCDFIFFLQRKTAMFNGKKQTRVVVRTQPQGGTECKVRGGVGVPEELEADWRVIRAALAGAPEGAF